MQKIISIIVLIIITVISIHLLLNCNINIEYAEDIQCPKCNSSLVLDYGYSDFMQGEHMHCTDCGTDFYLN